MQKPTAYFISAILLLFEQTLRPAGLLEVAGQRWRVEEMRMRSAVLRTGENVDVYLIKATTDLFGLPPSTHNGSLRSTLKLQSRILQLGHTSVLARVHNVAK